ncbi:glycosyltransferase [Streptomyces scopuliridis]|uniref:Glycosyltransferase n=1 Tax=Streptomyces scopuliridis TaxID=452529 RepID=A0ACD4ZTF3_9ACTN|nr:glycosyltransferase [Streptomyces scopuliridis]WSC01730.1 glycosyltransferase [Streptomyces scopuliridis]WSC04731.1 glycosyltransferase [Streptomyces scopuliridis]
MTTPRYGAVLLTMNDRPDDFPLALKSLLAQTAVELEVVVVGNGVEPEQVPHGIKTVTLPENVGIPEGRNVGAHALETSPDLLFFLDNDAVLTETDTLARLADELARDPLRAYIQPRIADPDTGVTVRRWVPRLRASDPTRPGTVTVMAEGVVVIRRDAFEEAGRWPGHFFLYHEGIDLSWRIWNLGYTGYYAPHLVIHHPASDPARHDRYYRLVARNRVWLALRLLPWPLIPPYLTIWVVLTVTRIHSPKALRTWFKGFREGFTGGWKQRSPLSWRTIARLTRAGRPPLI